LVSTCVASVNLYVASYSGGAWSGNLTTLSLGQNADSTFSLNQIATLNTSTNSPSWLTMDHENGILYLIDEAVNSTDGTVVAYKPNQNGQFIELGRQNTLHGGVSATLYAGGRGLAVAQYSSGTLQSFNVSSPGRIIPLETFNFRSGFEQGPIYGRQRAPHPHQAILDPSGQNIFVPDLGSDTVHILSIENGESLKLKRINPIKTKEGTGPRHGAFLGNGTVGVKFYLVGELDGTVAVFHIGYRQPQLGKSAVIFHMTAKYDTLAADQEFAPNPSGSSKVVPAEILVSVSSPLYPVLKSLGVSTLSIFPL
jgi:6-phosphogluconolactonase (cycloisomerase 2 family)